MKAMAVVLSAGLLASIFTDVTPVKAEEAIKKGTVITDFKEITDVKDLEPGVQYFFSIEEFGAEDAVAALPEGSAILHFAGTDVDKAVEDGTFITAEIKEYFDELEASLVSYEAYRQFMLESKGLDKIPTNEQEACEYVAKEVGLGTVPTSWAKVIEILPGLAEYYPTVDKFIAVAKEQLEAFEKDYPKDVNAFLAEEGYLSWSEFAQETFEYEYQDYVEYIGCLPDAFGEGYTQQEQQGYVAVVQSGEGFDGCPYGTIAYLTEETETMRNQLAQKWSDSAYDGAGWYYGCDGGGVGYVGPFYLYSYKVNEFTADDLIITFVDGWTEPTTATTVTKDDLTLSVVIDGEEIFIPFFELGDSYVDPTNEDTTITLTVGEIEKEVEVCNVEPGEIGKDVQIEEGAPAVSLENAVEALKDAVLTEAEHKLVASGVNIDIYMTVAGKDADEIGEDKAVLEEVMDEGDKAVYLDLKLFKKVGNNEPSAISEVAGGKIKVSIEVPETIKAYAANAKVVRVHEGVPTELETTYDATTNKLTFETDRFSTYAIVYNEVPVDNNVDKPSDGQQNEIPNTGDGYQALYACALMLIGGLMILFCLKGKEVYRKGNK